MDTLEAWRQWRTWLLVQGSGSPLTERSYAAGVLRFLAETGVKPVEDYREDDCARFLAEYASRGHARHQYAKAMRSFFKWATKRMLVLVDPMDDIKVAKPRRTPPVVLSPDELARTLIAAVFELGERPAWGILLMYLLGIRRIEAAGLKWEHIREGDTGPVIEIRTTKGADQRNPLPLVPLALECLARLRELPADPRAALGPEYIIQARPATVSRWTHVAGTAAGLHPRKVGSHRLRATVATRLLKDGVDVRTVQKLLGHLRLESTAWYLEEAGEAEVRAALEQLSVAV